MDIKLSKKAYRQKYGEEIKKLSPEVVDQKSSIISHRALTFPLLSEAKTVGAYVSFRNEVKTYDLLNHLLRRGFYLTLPVVNTLEHTMEFREIEKLQDLLPGALGIKEPKTGCYCHPEEIDLFFIPGVAFDFQGNRLGRGAGYYDHYFSRARPDAIKVGIAFQLQLAPKLPVNENDIKMDYIITEDQIIDCC